MSRGWLGNTPGSIPREAGGSVCAQESLGISAQTGASVTQPGDINLQKYFFVCFLGVES